MPKILDCRDVPDNYLREIGRIAIYWSELESLLHNALILALIDTLQNDGRAAAVFPYMSFPQKLDTLNALLRIADADVSETYRQDVQPILKEASTKRNAALHQVWYLEDGVVHRFDVKCRGEFKVFYQATKLEEVIEIASYISDATEKLVNLGSVSV